MFFADSPETAERMKTTPWTLNEATQVVFLPGYTTPTGYHRPAYWKANFMPRHWHEEVSPLWQSFCRRVRSAIATGNQVMFNQLMNQVIDTLGDGHAELVHHMEDYFSAHEVRGWLELRKRFNRSITSTIAPNEEEPVYHSSPMLIATALNDDKAMCRYLCVDLIERGQTLLILETIQRQAQLADSIGNTILIPIAIDLLGFERYEALRQQAADRLQGIATDQNVVNALEALYKASGDLPK